MAELPLDVTIYGFGFADTLCNIDVNRMNNALLDKGLISLEDVIFSPYTDEKSDCVWVVASDREMTEQEVKDTVDFIIDNDIEDIYILIDYPQ
jgi:hypothetical protein